MRHDQAWAEDMLGSTVDWWGEQATVVGVLLQPGLTLQFKDGRQLTVGESTTTRVRGRHRAESEERR